MAAIDCSGYTRLPCTRLVSATLGTNWQEVIIPHGCTVVTVTTSASVHYALPNGDAGRTQPVDGNAASSTADKCSVVVSGSEGKFGIIMRDPADLPAVVGVTPNRSIFLAAQSGTAAVSVEFGVGR